MSNQLDTSPLQIPDLKWPRGGGSPFPDIDQSLLLHAALGKRDLALTSWESWKSRNDIMGQLDYGSFRMLPMVYRQLMQYGLDDPLLPRLKGVYRQSWCKNQQLIHAVAGLSQAFESYGIPTMVLKGLPLSILYYKDTGIRPMSDADVLIPLRHAARAIEVLEEAGWRSPKPEDIPFNIRYGKSMPFINDGGMEFDLHWHPFFESHSEESDQGFWDRSQVVQYHQLTSRCMGPTDTLLHVLIHGMRWNPDPPIRWIPDACTILRTATDIDWEVFLNEVVKLRLAIPAKTALHYLASEFGQEIPPAVNEELNKLRVGFAEKYVFRHHLKEDAESLPEALMPRLRYLFSVYLRQSTRSHLLTQLFGFMRFLLFRTEGKNRWKILWYYFNPSKQPAGRPKPTAPKQI